MWCALGLPGSPALPSPSHSHQRGGEAPPGGQPYANDMKPVELAEPHGENEAGEQQGMGSALVSRCISIAMKGKGKYRIKMKGAACHGKACCGGI